MPALFNNKEINGVWINLRSFTDAKFCHFAMADYCFSGKKYVFFKAERGILKFPVFTLSPCTKLITIF